MVSQGKLGFGMKKLIFIQSRKYEQSRAFFSNSKLLKMISPKTQKLKKQWKWYKFQMNAMNFSHIWASKL